MDKTNDKGNPNDKGEELVKIKIGSETYDVHRGSHTVAELKIIGKVNPNYVLVQIIGDELKDLPNDGRVAIKGGEVFKSHPPVGDNS